MPNITNDELLGQVLSALNTQSDAITSHLTQMMHEEILAVNIKIEHEISGRIDALFDGYKLCHEQQWDLERRVRAIEDKLGMAI